MFGHYAGFILASYGIVAATIALLIIWVIRDGRIQAKTMTELEARGIHRRSERSNSPAAH
ncbi:heme exporter protein CcmD [Cohaesibacter celericrescens]|uniref:Heme exporter protein D n=1 Tax=Cohaesibacter celericrescens TaxID=2067669 RepID=A0A2N5XP88_9HYPH|nr:heme exporter protein CcmD [Cohaesibacter celericrescens]PLW76339.1 heme exporter protein CcmD [Cohaesibacter celericrescens]